MLDGDSNLAADWSAPVSITWNKRAEFPVEVLPDRLKYFVCAEAEATQTSPDLAGCLALAVCAAALAGRIEVHVRPGWDEPLNIYTVVVLGPGERKSAVFRHVVAPLHDFEKDEAARLGESIRASRAARDIKEGQAKRLKDLAAKCDDPQERESLTSQVLEVQRDLDSLQVSEVPRLIADEVTPEKLASLLSAHGGRMAVMSAEGEIFELMSRYARSGAPNLGVFLKGHAGDTLRVDRTHRPPEFVERPALTMGLAVQPDVLFGIATRATFRGRGMLGRILYSWPHSRMGSRSADPAPVDPTLLQDYRATVLALLRLPQGTDGEGRARAHTLTLDNGAHRALVAFQESIEPLLHEARVYGHMQDWVGKLPGAAVRLAGILHCAALADAREVPWSLAVSEDSMMRAVKVGLYFLNHAECAYSEMGVDPDTAGATHILSWLAVREWGRFGRRELHQALRGRFKRAADMAGPLGVLEESGHIRRIEVEEPTGPGRPASPSYEVNPIWLSQNSQNGSTYRTRGSFEDFEDGNDGGNVQ